jgi:hypothetical protein
MIGLAISWLFGIYFLIIINTIPQLFIEIIMYVGLSYLIVRSPDWFRDMSHIWGLLFTLLLTLATILTSARLQLDTMHVFYFVNMMINGFAGVYLLSTLICGVAVMWFMSLIGFQMGFGMGYISFGYGYKNQDLIPSATIIAGIVTLAGCYLKNVNPISKLKLFVPGMLWLGPFVFFVSLLILSSRMYARSNQYIINNIITIICGLGALLYGNLYNVPQLIGYSGTFVSIFLLEKYCEIVPYNSTAHAWSALCLGIILYVVNMYYRVEIEKYGIYEYFHLLPCTTCLDQ